MKKFFRSSFFRIWLPVAMLFFIFGYCLFFITSIFIQPLPEKKLSIATGRESGTYYKMALKYKELLEKESVEVDIVTTAGSKEALGLIKAKKVDIAFLQGGVVKREDREGLEALASIYYEPIWLFYNKNLSIEYLKDLQNKKISIGEEGSGTKPVAIELLKQNSIDTNSNKFFYLSSAESKEALIKGEIDAFFVITSPKSPFISELLSNQNIKVFNFKRAKAYGKKYDFLTDVTLYEGSINLQQNIPNKNLTLLSTTASLIVRDDLRHELIRVFIKQVKKVHSKESILENSNEFPSQNHLELPINKEAKIYLQNGDTWLEKIFPFWIASNIDRLKILIIPILTLLIPLIKGFLPVYRWTIRYKIYRWYEVLKNLDLKLDTLSKEELQKEYLSLLKLDKEIKQNTKTPLSYMGEYYNLRMHLKLIMDRMEKLLEG